MNRKRQQAELLFAAGQFFGPLLKVAENPQAFDADERTRIAARFFHDADAFTGLLQQFCCHGEPGHKYTIQFSKAQSLILSIHNYPAFAKGTEADMLKMAMDVAKD